MAAEDVLSITRLDLTFESKGRPPVEVFSQLNVTVREGEFVCVVGRSGCGKSTLLRLIAGLLPPTRGEVRVAGVRVTGPTMRVGVVFQDDRLLPWRTALANVKFGIEARMSSRESRERARALLDLVGLSRFEDHYPHELSGGMRQRVNLARALAVDPAILLMDEPFASLDPQIREEQQEALLGIWAKAGKTVLFVTHQVDEAVYLADRVIVLSSAEHCVGEEIAIPFPRPRSVAIRSELDFFTLTDRLGKRLRNQDAHAQTGQERRRDEAQTVR